MIITTPIINDVDKPKIINNIPYTKVARTNKPFDLSLKKIQPRRSSNSSIELNAVNNEITAAPPLKSLSAINAWFVCKNLRQWHLCLININQAELGAL